MPISYKDKITTLNGVGSKLEETFSKIEIFSIDDLVRYIPFKYRDTSELLSINQFKSIGEGTFIAQIVDVKNIYTRYRKKITKVRVADNEDRLDLTFFNQTYLSKTFKPKEWYIFDAKVSSQGKNIYNPKFEKFQGDPQLQVNLGKIYGTYHETKGINSRRIRKFLLDIRDDIPNMYKEFIPSNILDEEKLIHNYEALDQIHFPDSKESLALARERLAFEEMLRVAIRIEKQIDQRKGKLSKEIRVDKSLHDKFLSTLPYTLTKDQKEAIEEIFKDISSTNPMVRLINGDVGSGKTIVAISAIIQCINSCYSSILLAPTTVLAKQHYETLQNILKPLNIEVELCISDTKTISDADNKLIIGTHAVLFQLQLPQDLNLVIIDEQHRFGVNQREQLLQTTDHTPHYLTMSATPIPRSLTEIVFGSTEVSIIKQKPQDRIEIDTKYVPTNKRGDCFNWINKKIKESNFNEQAFIIYPIIEDNNSETRSVTTSYEELASTYFKDVGIAFLHGKMKDKEKNDILDDFRNKKYNILVSTSVIEVGIDIPDASIIVIENAERFGLAQLHQLRGRVGRSNIQSYCFVIPSDNIEERESALERLKYFSTHSSGFDVAQYDLEHRGPGEVYGVAQSGIPQLKIAQLTDTDLLKRTRSLARRLILEDNPLLDKINKELFN